MWFWYAWVDGVPGPRQGPTREHAVRLLHAGQFLLVISIWWLRTMLPSGARIIQHSQIFATGCISARLKKEEERSLRCVLGERRFRLERRPPLESVVRNVHCSRCIDHCLSAFCFECLSRLGVGNVFSGPTKAKRESRN